MKKLFALAVALSLPLAATAQTAPAAPAPAPAPAITVTPYGIVSLALYKDSGVFSNQDYPNYVLSEKEGATVISAKQSRFGFNVALPGDNLLGATLTGKIEADFMGGSSGAGGTTTVTTSITSAVVRLRHAFVNATVAVGPGKVLILAGQSDGLLNALHPESTSYLANPLFQQAGNIHRRTAQLRLGYDFSAADFGVKLEAAALNPTYGASDGTIATTDVANNAGNRSGTPDIEARLGFTLKPIAGIGGTIGASILAGSRTYGATVGGTTQDVSTSAFGIDFDAAVTQYLGLRGEFYSGKGIADAYAGAASASQIGAIPNKKAVESSGYWAQAIVKPIPEIWILGGLGQEKPKEATYAVAAAGSVERLQNSMIHAGLLVNMSKAWRVGLEWEQTTTKARAAVVGNLAATTELKASQLSLSTQLRF
jgi:hypothetical protein